MAFIRSVKTASGATAVQIIHKFHGHIERMEHIGSAHNAADLSVLLSLAKERLVGSQLSLFVDTQELPASRLKVGIRKSFSGLLLQTLQEQYEALGLNALADDDFSLLCIARIVEPTSKLDSLRVLADLGVDELDKNRLYRCLARVVANDYRSCLSKICVNKAVKQGMTLVLYDVTTLYFEVQEADEYRKPGMSKQRRLEPQIIVGLLVDQSGFPLGVQSFEGNKAETATILPVIEEFRNQHKIKDITVVADAAMLSAKNLQTLSEAGYHYIVGSRLYKIPYDIAEYQKGSALVDNQIITEQREGFRIVYQYRQKRASLDLRNIEKQIEKAQKIISGQTAAKRAKFLTVKTKEKILNQAMVDKAQALAGIKGYVTNLDVPDEQIISYYHQLFNVEASFRMAKSDLKARPIFHRKRDAIEAHLTVIFVAMALARTIEKRIGISIKHFVNTLRPIRSGIVTINGTEHIAEPEIPINVQTMLQRLRTGH